MKLEHLNVRGLLVLAIGLLGFNSAMAESEMEEIVVKGDLGSLPGERVDSVFGFEKSILETARSASTVSEEMMDRFNMQDIDELVVLAPGTFTQSFFGVAGSLDVRGTAGETYFRGVRRLDNPGNYPTPIGASDRVDIVRGPASPIYGPSKIGGYLNFNPKSARIEETGSYIEERTGELSYSGGSWDRSVLTAEVGGPAEFGGKPLGYYVYGEVEHSGSFYSNAPGVDQSLLQASFDMDMSDTVRLQFGGMWHDYKGSQNAGWNRLTQDLIDNGTYVTGTPIPLDTSGDGFISHDEYYAGNINPFALYAFFGQKDIDLATLSDASFGFDYENSNLPLQNVGTTTLPMHATLIAADDTLENQVTTLYFDIDIDLSGNWSLTNKLFYEAYENLNENAYGFSQFHDSSVVEDQLILSGVFEGDSMTTSVQISPSIRHTKFKHGDDYYNEYFSRRDLTGPSTALDRRVLSTRIDSEYSEYYVGDYTDLGFGVMADFTHESGLSLLVGARYDSIDMEVMTPEGKTQSDAAFTSTEGGVDVPVNKASDEPSGVSWSASLSWSTPVGLVPYVTASEQSTVIAGQGSELQVGNVYTNAAFDSSELIEFGLKGSLLDDRLYFALSSYEMERVDFSAQSITVNQAVKTEGTEFELRWVVNDNFLMTLGYSNVEALMLATIAAGSEFSFLGAEDLPLIDPALLWGGQVGGLISVGPSKGVRAGMPETIMSVTGTYDFGNGMAVSGSVVDVDSVASGQSFAVTLPAYTLVNLSVSYEAEDWGLIVAAKNVTDERYFRANFPDLFGTTVVLPELPRHYQAKLTYRF
ncbi:MAG: TonB-dependent siderophore receptor [Candidatus Azotimanducaceae bacterium]